MDAAVKKSLLTGPVMLARGVKKRRADENFGPVGSMVGEEITEKNFPSTPVDVAAAKGFTGIGGGAVIHYHVTGEIHALPVNSVLGSMSEMPEEEILMDRGLTWRVA